MTLGEITFANLAAVFAKMLVTLEEAKN